MTSPSTVGMGCRSCALQERGRDDYSFQCTSNYRLNDKTSAMLRVESCLD